MKKLTRKTAVRSLIAFYTVGVIVATYLLRHSWWYYAPTMFIPVTWGGVATIDYYLPKPTES